MRKLNVFNICGENVFKSIIEKPMICFNNNVLYFLRVKMNIWLKLHFVSIMPAMTIWGFARNHSFIGRSQWQLNPLFSFSVFWFSASHYSLISTDDFPFHVLGNRRSQGMKNRGSDIQNACIQFPLHPVLRVIENIDAILSMNSIIGSGVIFQ